MLSPTHGLPELEAVFSESIIFHFKVLVLFFPLNFGDVAINAGETSHITFRVQNRLGTVLR